jgi:hypothetical protein
MDPTITATKFNAKIPANIALDEVHEGSGMEGASGRVMEEEGREGRSGDEFKSFAIGMGYGRLVEISKDTETLENLDTLDTPRRIERLIEDKAPMRLFYSGSLKGDGGSGHAINRSIAYDSDAGKWEASVHNTGAGMNTGAAYKNFTGKMGHDQLMRQCAYTFTDLDGDELKSLIEGIRHIQMAKSDEEYAEGFKQLYEGNVTCDDGSLRCLSRPKDPIRNYTVM